MQHLNPRRANDREQHGPEDRDAVARELATKAQAAQMLVQAGFKAKDVLKAVGLPEMEFVGSTLQPHLHR